MSIVDPENARLRHHQDHPRDWRRNRYVYPVISRRSRGLSIGVNINPDTACNFDCVYCQVDRSTAAPTLSVDPSGVGNELEAMITLAKSGALFEDPAFADVPSEFRAVRDIAFSGDGEPTTCKRFKECVETAATLRRGAGLTETKIVLITDACYLTRPKVVEALAVLDGNNGEIWAKLDAGTEDYFRQINRPNFTLNHVLDNIIATARLRPIVIQSLFMQLHGEVPSEAELTAYADRLGQIIRAGGTIERVQVYTIARQTAESYVAPLGDIQVDSIANLVRTRTGLQVEAFYGPGQSPEQSSEIS